MKVIMIQQHTSCLGHQLFQPYHTCCYSHLGFQVTKELLYIASMSRDSQVTSMPTGQWSCDSLENGILEAARIAGITIDPSKLGQAWGLDGVYIVAMNVYGPYLYIMYIQTWTAANPLYIYLTIQHHAELQVSQAVLASAGARPATWSNLCHANMAP